MPVPIYVYHVHPWMVPLEARREHHIPWNWSYRWLWATKWLLGTELKSSARAICAVYCLAISPALHAFCPPISLYRPSLWVMHIHPTQRDFQWLGRGNSDGAWWSNKKRWLQEDTLKTSLLDLRHWLRTTYTVDCGVGRLWAQIQVLCF